MTTYYVPQSMTAPIDPHQHQVANSLVPLQYQAVGPTVFSQSANNNQTISSYPFSNKRSTPPHQHQSQINAQPTHHHNLQMSSSTTQPYAGHYNPANATAMIFAPPNLYPGMVAAYQSSTQSNTTPIITSPSSSNSSVSYAAIPSSIPQTVCEPSSPANSYTTVVHTQAQSPTTDANKSSTGGSPTQALSPPITNRKPLFQSNRFSSEGSFPRPSRSNEQYGAYNYTSNTNINQNPQAFQPNKFKTNSLQHKRPPGEQTSQPFNHNNNFHQSYQAAPLIAGGVPPPFRHLNPAANDKFRTNGPRPRPPNLDLRRSVSMASSSSTVSPGATNDISNGEQQQSAAATVHTPPTVHHIPHSAANNFRIANSFVEGTAAAALHHQQQQAASFYGAAGAAGAIGPAAYSGAGGGSPGMYVKLGGAFFAHHVGFIYVLGMKFYHAISHVSISLSLSLSPPYRSPIIVRKSCRKIFVHSSAITTNTVTAATNNQIICSIINISSS